MATDLDNNINHRLAILHSLSRRLAIKTISKAGVTITPEQWAVLHYLWKKDGLPVGDIVRQTKKDFANVTRILDKLIQTGYVRKERDKTDTRSYLIYLLPKGREIEKAVERIQDEVLDKSLQGISNSEQELILSLLERIEQNISDELDK